MGVAYSVKTPVYRALSLVADLGFNVGAAVTYLQLLVPAVSLPFCFKPMAVVIPPRAWHLLRKCILEFLRQPNMFLTNVKRIGFWFSQWKIEVHRMSPHVLLERQLVTGFACLTLVRLLHLWRCLRRRLPILHYSVDNHGDGFGEKMGGSGASLASEDVAYVVFFNVQLLRFIRLKALLSLFLKHLLFQRCILEWRVSTAMAKVTSAIHSVQLASNSLQNLQSRLQCTVLYLWLLI